MDVQAEINRIVRSVDEVQAVETLAAFDGCEVYHLCRFKDAERAIADGRGRSLAAALRSCQRNFLLRQVNLEDAARKAVLAFGSPTIFSTACFQLELPGELQGQAAEILAGWNRVVRLTGGSHWLLLPGRHARYGSSEE